MTAAPRPRLLVCTPAYDNRVHAAFAGSLSSAMCCLAQAGVEARWTVQGGAIISDARNLFVGEALAAGCSHLLMADSDMSWPGDAPLRLLAHGVDMVGAIYENRMNQSGLPGRMAIRNARPSEDHPELVEADGIGTGLLLVSKSWILRMWAAHPNGPFEFQSLPWGGYRGEDYVACDRWRALGGRVFGDPAIPCQHYGQSVASTTFMESVATRPDAAPGAVKPEFSQ